MKATLAKWIINQWIILSLDLIIATGVGYFFLHHEFAAIASSGYASLIMIFLGSFFVFGTHKNIIQTSLLRQAGKLIVAHLAACLLLYITSVKLLQYSPASLSFGAIFITNIIISLSYRWLAQIIVAGIKETSDDKLQKIALCCDQKDFDLMRSAIEQTYPWAKVQLAILPHATSQNLKVVKEVDLQENWEEYLNNHARPDLLIIAEQYKNIPAVAEMTKTLTQHCINVQYLPTISSWVTGSPLQRLKSISIEDLLQRPTTKIVTKDTAAYYAHKCICITGAAGSIGSEIVKQLLEQQPRKLILIDQAETPLFYLLEELKRKSIPIEWHIADVRNTASIDKIFQSAQPDIIIHAAAYKHVPMMEEQPLEAIKTNVIGTINVMEAAKKHAVERLVLISTDKAVNPTNVMGATKRLAEILTLCYTPFFDVVTTRFGNVLASNGSVVPIFSRQIMNGGPVTVTHPDITRYFMTIKEASHLVLEAGAIGKSSEVLVFDMDEPVKILDLAQQMIKLAGLQPYKDISIQFTELRKGEKLHEELFGGHDELQPSAHPSIMIAKQPQLPNKDFEALISQLKNAVAQQDEVNALALLQQLVPTYQPKASNNPITPPTSYDPYFYRDMDS